MPNFEQNFITAGYTVIQRCTLEKAPANPRERAEMVARALGVTREQVVKAIALQMAGSKTPFLFLISERERLDLEIFSRASRVRLEFCPEDQIQAIFGATIQTLSPFAGSFRNCGIDSRIIDFDAVVVPSGDPLVELLVDPLDIHDFLAERLGPDAVHAVDFDLARHEAKTGVVEPRVLKGFRDYLPEEMLPRQAMIATITEVFERFGFVPLQTPALEYSDILLGKLGSDAEKLLFRFRDNGGRDVCLRYDLTVPLARVAAQYPEIPKPFKRYQIAPVWRAEKPGRGRFREFFQCDCDIVGSASLLYDAECIALDLAVMAALGVKAEVRFNNRKVLAALAATLNVTEARQMAAIFRTVDKIPAQGKARVRELLKADAACTDGQVEKLMQFVEISGGNDEMLARLSELLGPGAAQAIAELRRVKEYVEALTPPPDPLPQGAGEAVASSSAPSTQHSALRLDFSIARGLDYYTGTVYETFLTELPGSGSVMSGGRYDGLIERYLGKPMPAVGISVGIDRLFSYLAELGKVKKSAVTSRVCVVAMDAACLAPALRVLSQFRGAGIAAEMVIENDQKLRLDKQLSLAGKKGIPYAAIIGGNEVAKGTVMLKDLVARTQEELTVEQAVGRLRARGS
ncbi:MAG: histidine--tRNA ligase [Planctomycetota bacterium]|nr:histidine--tRNA ligase [Planctomycetota bacterium]